MLPLCTARLPLVKTLQIHQTSDGGVPGLARVSCFEKARPWCLAVYSQAVELQAETVLRLGLTQDTPDRIILSALVAALAEPRSWAKGRGASPAGVPR